MVLKLTRSSVAEKVFPDCDFYVIPEITVEDLCQSPVIDIFSFPKYTGRLAASLGERIGNKGTFKTAHPGRILEMALADGQSGRYATAPATSFFLSSKETRGHVVCIKQIYHEHESGLGIIRAQGPDEAKDIFGETVCLLFASALLDMAYSFMDRQDGKKIHPRPFHVPQVRFVHAMIAVIHGEKDKTFLIEEYITDPFRKYVGNAAPAPISGLSGTSLELAEFFCFVQHVQWEKSPHIAYTSDFQGQ